MNRPAPGDDTMRAPSLRGRLLAWLLPPLIAVALLNAVGGYYNARSSAEVILDRMLLASARTMAERIGMEGETMEAIIPPSAIEMFATQDKDTVAYMIADPKGALIAGYPDLVFAGGPPTGFAPAFATMPFRHQTVRAVALRQAVTSDDPGQGALVVVAETLHGYHRIVRDIWLRAAAQQALLIALAAALAWAGLAVGFRPLARLSENLRQRDPTNLTPLDTRGLYRETLPLVDALNAALARTEAQIARQKRFVDDAAHQLRTPLTLLTTQASVGTRESDIEASRETHRAILTSLRGMTRMTNQLLTLAKADDTAARGAAPIAMARLVADAIDGIAPAAASRGMTVRRDLAQADFAQADFAQADFAQADLIGDAVLLRELVVNLLDNAVKYGPDAGMIDVTLRAEGDLVVLRVEDQGEGIPPDERTRVFERFYRRLGTGADGTGLGLAIARDVATMHRGTIRMRDRDHGDGLCVEVVFYRGADGVAQDRARLDGRAVPG